MGNSSRRAAGLAMKRASRAAGQLPAATVTYANQDRARDAIRSLVGRDLSEHELAGLAGALPGAHVTVRGLPSTILLDVTGPNYTASVHLQRVTEDGVTRLSLLNWMFTPSATFSPREEAQMLRGQVRAAQRAGVDQLRVKARSESDDFHRLPLVGYDTPVAKLVVEQPRLPIPREAASARTLQEIIRTKAGHAWWQATEMYPTLDFQTVRGSRSVQRFNTYLRKNGLAKV